MGDKVSRQDTFNSIKFQIQLPHRSLPIMKPTTSKIIKMKSKTLDQDPQHEIIAALAAMLQHLDAQINDYFESSDAAHPSKHLSRNRNI